ncbi:Cytosolic endo-beta-N-acetylglucosaminidase [Wickerhamomyces ciferrii]|uniref:Cytosolic endo-beta-N-acetylglucosaminidase n=1 Tax=Wickerhamomyces ciferrii (strain ATCC 14091 / BCRC 22168 / CBS 111 / JCM 3599 / NBRC 0793 / NRRL Y-1031 F-60-10) TaxID=1206466 RepID=K0KK66_WICCF|nr:Cytosolic endo-beta-N-acetylglucosaminidase [Wickerhamomyces ciferrii]CCH42567.1 Cytosolic endo-beta-N-acetylglucosaminidase [Wickerhamomyces ciferrii]
MSQDSANISIENDTVSSIKFGSFYDLEYWYLSKRDIIDAFRIPRESLEDYQRFKEPEKNNSDEYDPKVLVCHDYKGNYQDEEDQNPLGYFPHSSGQHYYIQYPSLVDIFVYFSHNRVSVPPVSWINSLHKQGIQVLGTIIVEGMDFAESDRLLSKDENGNFKFVEILAQIARYYKFDGWFLNIESRLTSFGKSFEVPAFEEALKTRLHQLVSDSKLIWYDSLVTEKNRVFYQNSVNEWNYDHFNASDLFFTNYWWTQEKLSENIKNIGLLGAEKKLFVGIDIWGRGSKVGGGGFESSIAINALKKSQSNVALFAPAWTYENFDKEDFYHNDKKFWLGNDSSDFTGGSVSTYVKHYTAPVYTKNGNAIFYTNFSTGEGSKFRVFAQTVFNNNWVNGNIQSAVPVIENSNRFKLYYKDTFNGGSSLKLTHRNSILNDYSSDIFTLFHFRNDIDSNNLNVSVSFKHLKEVPQNSRFQIDIKYYIERRYRSVTRSREGFFRLPLTYTNQNWKYIETGFALPRLQAREHFVLESVQARWVDSTDDANSEIDFEGDESSRSWVMIPQSSDPNIFHELLIGDILIEGIKHEVKVESIISVKKIDLGEKKVLVEWKDDENVLYWLIYVNAKFLGVAHSSVWKLKRGDKIRVDIFTRSGKVIKGQDLFI